MEFSAAPATTMSNVNTTMDDKTVMDPSKFGDQPGWLAFLNVF